MSYLNFIRLYTLSYVKIIDNCMDMTLWIVGLRIRIFNFAIKLLTCILYIVRVMSDSVPSEWWVYRYFFFLRRISNNLLIFCSVLAFDFIYHFRIEYLFVSYRVNITLAHAEKLIGSRRQIFLFFSLHLELKAWTYHFW